MQNPDEEFEVHKGTLDAALEAGLLKLRAHSAVAQQWTVPESAEQ